jgi:hypothetical protein
MGIAAAARDPRWSNGPIPREGASGDYLRTYESGVVRARAPPKMEGELMLSTNRWQLPVVGRLGLQHGLAVGWFLLVGALAVMLLPGPAGRAASTLVEPQTVGFGGQSHCGIVVGIGASDFGSGSGDTRCASVESGRDSQVTTDGFGDIGMQFQQSPVKSAISNVHVSNEGDNNSNNTIIGNHDEIVNGNAGVSDVSDGVGAAASFAPPADDPAVSFAPPADDPAVSALPVTDTAPASTPQPASGGGQSHCGVVVGVGASGGGSGSGDTRCASVESGRDSQVATDGFGDIGMQFQQSPVNAPITNVHISNEGNNNSNNTIVGNHNTIYNFNFGMTANA